VLTISHVSQGLPRIFQPFTFDHDTEYVTKHDSNSSGIFFGVFFILLTFTNCFSRYRYCFDIKFVFSVPGQLSRYSDELWTGRLWIESQKGLTLFHRVQIGSGAHPASYPVRTSTSNSEGNAAWA
jgi:hypothetical protein